MDSSARGLGKHSVFLSPSVPWGGRYHVYSDAVLTRHWASQCNTWLCWCPCPSARGRWCYPELALQRERSVCPLLAWSPASRVSLRELFACTVPHQSSACRFCCFCQISMQLWKWLKCMWRVRKEEVRCIPCRGLTQLSCRRHVVKIEVALRPVFSCSTGPSKGPRGQTWYGLRDSKWFNPSFSVVNICVNLAFCRQRSKHGVYVSM